MKRKFKPTTLTSAASESALEGPATIHLGKKHHGLCILALSAKSRKVVPAERWDETRLELHAQALGPIGRLPAAVRRRTCTARSVQSFLTAPLQALGEADHQVRRYVTCLLGLCSYDGLYIRQAVEMQKAVYRETPWMS